MSPAAFDAVAAAYDAGFTATRLGRCLRGAVWARLGPSFGPGQRVLDLGCGTGEDAVWLARRGVRVVATDVAPAMLALARDKAALAGVGARVSVEPLDLAAPDPGRWPPASFDGAVSSFGALNCVGDRRPLASALAGWVRPGGRLVLVVMGPLCAWEVGWHLLHGQGRTAFRRLRRPGTARLGGGPALPVWYPGPGRLERELAPHFRRRERAGIGAVLPPSSLAGLVEGRPRLVRALAALEARLGPRAPWPWLSDHYLLVLERA